MKHQTSRCIYAIVLAVTLLMVPNICLAQQAASSSASQGEQTPVIEKEAIDALVRMGKFLQTLKTFEVSAQIPIASTRIGDRFDSGISRSIVEHK